MKTSDIFEPAQRVDEEAEQAEGERDPDNHAPLPRRESPLARLRNGPGNQSRSFFVHDAGRRMPLAGALARQCLPSETKRQWHWRPKAAASGTP